ncbi:hypothetical protein C8R44DRAFT_775477 [Mycena epipterygia]|nr:hypothetical protein C8R44DRAFT_775477 [Mycena epipterygia]
MSTKKGIFPRRKPVDQPPLRCGELVDGHRTPSYALAWVCPSATFYKNLGGGVLGKVDDCNFTDVVSEKWRSCPKFGHDLKPIPYPGMDGNFYLIAMFNERNADHLNRVLDPEDPLIQSARISMGVDQTPALEDTLQWIRWPIRL